MTTTKTGFLSLPNELVLAITGYLDSPSLHSLNHTCRHFYSLTLHPLYTSVTCHKLDHFLRTITSPSNSSTSLGSLLKHVTCHIPQSDDSAEDLSFSEREALHDAFMQLNLPRKEYQEDLASNYKVFGNPSQFHWHLDFFLCFFPQVESLELHGAGERWDLQQNWFSIHELSSENYFSRLRHIKVNGRVTLRNVSTLLAVPALRELELTHLHNEVTAVGAAWEWGESLMNLEDMEDRSSDLESLVIRDATVSPMYLTPVLQKIKALKRFEYDQGCSDWNPMPLPDVSHYKQLVGGLQTQASSLEHLRIQISSTHRDDSMERLLAQLRLIIDDAVLEDGDLRFENYAGLDGYLPMFPHLKSLDFGVFNVHELFPLDDYIGHMMLHLPRGLKKLRLAFRGAGLPAIDREIEARFVDLLLEKGGFATREVEEVCLVSPLFEEGGDWATPGGRKRIEKAFDDVGVKFTNEWMDDRL